MEREAPSNGGPDRPARHVGSRKRARGFPKGRQLDTDALEDIRKLLGDRPRRADLLIEYLHLIQDKYNYISAAHLKALCEEMGRGFAEWAAGGEPRQLWSGGQTSIFSAISIEMSMPR